MNEQQYLAMTLGLQKRAAKDKPEKLSETFAKVNPTNQDGYKRFSKSLKDTAKATSEAAFGGEDTEHKVDNIVRSAENVARSVGSGKAKETPSKAQKEKSWSDKTMDVVNEYGIPVGVGAGLGGAAGYGYGIYTNATPAQKVLYALLGGGLGGTAGFAYKKFGVDKKMKHWFGAEDKA